jgi:anti-sigma B factor antagonist
MLCGRAVAERPRLVAVGRDGPDEDAGCGKAIPGERARERGVNGSGPELYAAAAAAREAGDWPRVVELCARLLASGAPPAEAVALMREARDALRQRRATTPEEPGAPESEAPSPPAEAIPPESAELPGLAAAPPASDTGTLAAEIQAQAEARLAEVQARLADLQAQLDAAARAEPAMAPPVVPPAEELPSPQPAALAHPEPPAEALAAPQPEPPPRHEPPAEALASPEPTPAPPHRPDEIDAAPIPRASGVAETGGPPGSGAQTAGTFEARDDVTVLSPRGDLDAATIDKFQAQIEQVFSAGARKFVIDFGGVTFLDSSGLWALVRLYGRLRDGGGGARLARVSPGVMRIFELTRLTEYFDIRPSVEEALASLQ